MGQTVTLASNVRMTQVSTIKTLLGITSTANDTTLGEIADRASAAIRSLTDREYALQSYVERLSADGGTILQLRNTPIQSVTSIALSGDTVTDFSIEDKEDGQLFRESGWSWTVQLVAALGQFPGASLPLNKWVVTYVAGYDMPGDTSTATGVIKLPGDLEEGAIKTVKSWFQKRSASEVKSKKVGALAIQYALEDSKHGLPSTVEGLLRKWEYLEAIS